MESERERIFYRARYRLRERKRRERERHRTPKYAHHPHRINNEDRQCEPGGGAYFVFSQVQLAAHHPLKNATFKGGSLVRMVCLWQFPRHR